VFAVFAATQAAQCQSDLYVEDGLGDVGGRSEEEGVVGREALGEEQGLADEGGLAVQGV
jgi:hypothetical protein